LLHRLNLEKAQRSAGDQKALNIERVVDGGMHGEEALPGAANTIRTNPALRTLRILVIVTSGREYSDVFLPPTSQRRKTP
jgi:hypothetical protein